MHSLVDPACMGYWHAFKGLQKFPTQFLYLQHTVIQLICSVIRLKRPALTRISWYSLVFDFQRLQLSRWFLMSLRHSNRFSIFTPRLSPHEMPAFSEKEQTPSIEWSWVKKYYSSAKISVHVLFSVRFSTVSQFIMLILNAWFVMAKNTIRA